MFSYSERPGTPAARKLTDDISLEVKNRRLSEVIERQRIISGQLNKKDEGKNFEVLIEGLSKKSDKQMRGKTSHNKVVIFDVHQEYKIGDYVNVYITSSTTATLFGTIIQ